MEQLFNLMNARIEKLEAAREVSSVLHSYMQLCDGLDEGMDLNPLIDLFTEDAIWEGKGKRYENTFGKREGINAIREMFEKYTLPPAHFSLNVHFLTSEKVDVRSEIEAEGTWVLLQTATFADGRGLSAPFNPISVPTRLLSLSVEIEFPAPA
jgi:hypothetical protein